MPSKALPYKLLRIPGVRSLSKWWRYFEQTCWRTQRICRKETNGLQGTTKEAQKPPQIPTTKKTPRLYTNFLEKFVRTFPFFPVTWVRNPMDIVQKNLSRWTFLFWVDFFGLIFLLWNYHSTRNYYILDSENNFYCNHNIMYRRINLLPEFIMLCSAYKKEVQLKCCGQSNVKQNYYNRNIFAVKIM